MTKLYVDTTCGSALERHALFLTEFFNSTVDRAAYVGDSIPDGLPIERVDVARDGALELAHGRAAASPTTSSPSRASSSRAGASPTGTAADLVLWRVGGPGARRRRDVERRAARGAACA